MDAWRGLAALSVVVFHSADVFLGRSIPSGSTRYLLDSIMRMGYLGVELFFVISGYCIIASACSALNNPYGHKQFISARFRRIFPAYWLSLILLVCGLLVVSVAIKIGWIRLSGYPIELQYLRSPVALLTNITLTQLIFRQPSILIPAWTLCYEAAFYLVVFGLIRYRRLNVKTLLNLVHTITVLALLLLILSPQHVFYPLDLWPLFGLGALVYHWLNPLNSKRPVSWTFSISFLFIIFIVFRNIRDYSEEPSRITFSVGFIFALLIVLLRRYELYLQQRHIVKMFSWLGLISYSLYLIHGQCIVGVDILTKVLRHFPGSSYYFLIFSILFSICCAYLFYRFCERPFLQKKKLGLIAVNQAEMSDSLV